MYFGLLFHCFKFHCRSPGNQRRIAAVVAPSNGVGGSHSPAIGRQRSGDSESRDREAHQHSGFVRSHSSLPAGMLYVGNTRVFPKVDCQIFWTDYKNEVF